MTNVLICSKAYFRGDVAYRVMIDGQVYTINKYLLAALQDGDTVEDLQLEPDDREDEDEYSEPSPGARMRSNTRHGMFGGR